MIDIKGMNKARVLKALYDRSHVQGLGALQARSGLTMENFEELIKTNKYLYFDYLFGKVLKVDLSKDWLDERLYDRDNGPGAAEAAIMEEMTRPDQTRRIQ